MWVNEPHLDRVPVEYLQQKTPESSLLLIKAKKCRISREDYTNECGKKKSKVRLLFTYNDIEYNFGVTDIEIEKQFKNQPEGLYPIETGDVYLCLSLGVPFNGFCYKLVATII